MSGEQFLPSSLDAMKRKRSRKPEQPELPNRKCTPTGELWSLFQEARNWESCPALFNTAFVLAAVMYAGFGREKDRHLPCARSEFSNPPGRNPNGLSTHPSRFTAASDLSSRIDRSLRFPLSADMQQ